MNTETDYLKSIAEEIALIPQSNDLKTPQPNKYLVTELKRIEKEVMLHLNTVRDYIQYDAFYLNIMNKLVCICDQLFDADQAISPDVLAMIDVLSSLRSLVPYEITLNVKLPKAFKSLQSGDLRNSWSVYSKSMKMQNVDQALIFIAAIPFTKFTEPSAILYWRDFTWIKGYQSKLEIMDWENTDCGGSTEALMSLLIGRDFNDDRFYVYCKKYIQARIENVHGKHQKLMEFAACEKLILQDTQIGMPPYDPRANTLSRRLIKWITEEVDFIKAHEKEPSYCRLHIHLPNYKIAFLFKLFSEFKLFGDTPFKEVARQIAGTCLSQDGAEILPQTIVSKAYPKDQATLAEMENLLVRMLEYVRRFIRKN